MTILSDTTDAATDAGFAFVVFAKILRIRQHCFEELERLNPVAFVVDRNDAVHTNVLNDAKVSEVFLSESHPEACTLNSGEVLNEAFDFFVVEQVRFARTYVRISKGLVNFKGFCFNPLAIFPIESLLGDFTNIDFGVEVCSECFVVVTSIAVNNVKIVDFDEMVFCCISRIN